jgi:hemoglobin
VKLTTFVSITLACGAFACRAEHPRAKSAPATTAAAASAATDKPDDRKLFDRLGGLDAIKAVVDDFVGRTTTDPRIMDRFFNTDATHLKQMLVEQVCQATGGPCAYSGRDMKSTHGGMVLVEDEFTALVEDLTKALDDFHVPAREKGELLGALGGLEPQIVAPASALHPIDDGDLARVEKLSVKSPEAQRLLGVAVIAGRRGQRSYAEQLFSRAELLVGPEAVAQVAPVFRASAPPRVATPTSKMPLDTAPQPKVAVGGSEEEGAKGAASVEGAILVDGLPLRGVGVVMLTPESGGAKSRVAKQRVVEQRGRTFAPHLLAVPVGSTVAFPNFDSIFHNVFSISPTASFDLGLYRNGESRAVTFKKEGIVRIGCNLHSSMSAYVIVVAAPHYAVSDDAGTFAFHALAPGRYKMKAWSERSAKPILAELVVKAGVNHVSVPLAGGATDDNPDKFGELR